MHKDMVVAGHEAEDNKEIVSDQIVGKIPNVTDTQGVRIFRAPTGAEGPAPRVERRLGTGMGFAARRPPGQQCAAGICTRTGTHLPWLSYRVLAGRGHAVVLASISLAMH